MTTVEEAAVELREDIPLQKRANKSSSWCNCNEDCLGGSRFINASFGTLTAVITIALVVQIYYGDYQVVPHGSVATDSLECSEIGTSVLKQGGNSVDAAIASTFCLAVVAPHLTGLDAEAQLLIYNHRTRSTPDFIDISGPETLSADIPRLVLGLAYVHQHYASISWKDLVQPAVEIARNGFLISKMFVQALNRGHGDLIFGHLEPGQIIKLETLADTLEKIAGIPEDELYSHITITNQPRQGAALRSSFNSYNIYVPGTPTIGPLLLINLHQIEKFNFTPRDIETPEYVYEMTNVTQTIMRDIHVDLNFHNGTSTNVAVIDLHDNYVSLVTGMNSYFGSGEMTSEGYILDVKEKDRMCSRLPVIITDAVAVCGRRIVLGTNDMSTATQIIASLLIGKENATESAEAPRVVISDGYSIGIEGNHSPLFGDIALNHLKSLTPFQYQVPEPYFSSNIVEKHKDDLTSHSDSRGGGIASRF